ncbi:hypothetical protein EVAR_84646_1 [Eumeta japonica]|uniref:Uncharacterized protein n=1 Tax=Eumeta variegata TaxID=151549 RepID=A0A4C1V0G9_EUMVA|nr:hypothetical protein EVAR_84646_1 [Eumeta japonica]
MISLRPETPPRYECSESLAPSSKLDMNDFLFPRPELFAILFAANFPYASVFDFAPCPTAALDSDLGPVSNSDSAISHSTDLDETGANDSVIFCIQFPNRLLIPVSMSVSILNPVSFSMRFAECGLETANGRRHRRGDGLRDQRLNVIPRHGGNS